MSPILAKPIHVILAHRRILLSPPATSKSESSEGFGNNEKEYIGAYRGGKQNITEVVYLNRQEEKCVAVGTPEPSVESR